MVKNGMRPIHPGEILLEEFMKPATPPLNANMLAKAIDVPANRIRLLSKDSEVLPEIRRCIWRPFSVRQPNSG